MLASVFAVLLLVCSVAVSPAHAQPQLVNGVAVIVDTSVITYDEVERSLSDDLRLIYRQYERQPQLRDERIAQLRKDRLELLVERQLILQEFKRKGYVIPDSVFDRALNERIREEYGGDRLRVARTLQAQGTTMESFRKRHREQMIVGLMTREFVSSDKIVISPARVEAFYQENQDKFKLEDQIKLRMIVIAQAPGGEAGAARKLAGEIRAKIKEGAAFAEMASIYSTGSQRSQGGDWGWVERKVLREDLAEVAFKMKPGELSEVIDRPDASFLMLIEETKPSHVRPLSEVTLQVEKMLRDMEYDRLRKKWISGLKEKSFVRYF